MTEEQKQALIGLCKIEIKRWKAASESDPNMRYMVELMGVALAALTAQPVELPNCVDGLHGVGPVMSADEVIAAIRAAGYQVESE